MLEEAGIRTYAPEEGWFRFVTHRDVSEPALREAAGRLPALVERLAGEDV